MMTCSLETRPPEMEHFGTQQKAALCWKNGGHLEKDPAVPDGHLPTCCSVVNVSSAVYSTSAD